MRQALSGPILKLLAPCLAALFAFAAVASPSLAQDQDGSDEPIKQMRLTEDQVKNFIAAQPDLTAVTAKLQDAEDTVEPELQNELDSMARKHGFSDFAELDDVAANISIVMAGLDFKTGEFIEPVDALKKELEEVNADTSLTDDDKKQLVEELNEAISTTPKLQYMENVELVKQHWDEIEKSLQD